MPVITADKINKRDIRQANNAIAKLNLELEKLNSQINTERASIKLKEAEFLQWKQDRKKVLYELGQKVLEATLEIGKIEGIIDIYQETQKDLA